MTKQLTDIVTEEVKFNPDTNRFSHNVEEAYKLIQAHEGKTGTEDIAFLKERLAGAPDKNPAGYQAKVYVAKDVHGKIVGVTYASKIHFGEGRYGTFVGYHALDSKVRISEQAEKEHVRKALEGLDPENRAYFKVFEVKRANKKDANLARIAKDLYGANVADVKYKVPKLDVEKGDKAKGKEEDIDLWVAGPSKEHRYDAGKLKDFIKAIFEKEYLVRPGREDYLTYQKVLASGKNTGTVGINQEAGKIVYLPKAA